MRPKSFYLCLITICLSLLLSCGSSDDTAPNPTVSGIAATGAAIPNAPVTLIDSTGSTNNGTTDSGGAFSISVAGMTAPYLIKVTYNSGANILYSFAAAAGTANVNPLTSLAVHQAFNGDPSTIIAPGATPAAVASAMATLSGQINGAITAIQNNILATYPAIASVNPITGSFKVGEGIDKLLDQMNLTVNATGGTVSIGITSGGKSIFSGSITHFIPANMNMNNMPTITFSTGSGSGTGGTTTVPPTPPVTTTTTVNVTTTTTVIPTGGTGAYFQGSWKYGGVTFFTFTQTNFSYMVGGISGVASYSSDGTVATIGALQWTFRSTNGTTLTWDQNPGTTYTR